MSVGDLTPEQHEVWWQVRLALLGWDGVRVGTSTGRHGMVSVHAETVDRDGKPIAFRGGLALQLLRDPEAAEYVADWARELVIDLKRAAGVSDERPGALFPSRLPASLRRFPRTGGAVLR